MNYGQWSLVHSISVQSKSVDIFSGGYKVATKEPLAWGLCHNKEMNSNTYNFCDKHYENTYLCVSGAAYCGLGPLPIYWYLPFQSH